MEFPVVSATHWCSGRKTLEDYPQIKENFKTREEIKDRIDITYVTINSLEDLLKFIDIVGHEVVLGDNGLMIYDNYLE